MLFNSVEFLVFFPIVVLIYWVLPKKIRYIWLLVASYVFYMGWNAEYALLIATSTIITYLCGLGVEAFGNKEGKGALIARKLVIATGFVSNLGILFFYKYFDFFLENANRVLVHLKLQTIESSFSVLLPVGISFYTFQALGYIVDVYRGEIKAEKNPLKYALFVSFFPQLVAGPIERSKNLLEQIRDIPQRKTFEYRQVANGLIVMLYGYFLKMVVADRISIVAEYVFGRYYELGSVELIVGAVAFAIQIYCDFGSYSLIAIGAAQVMGFTLMENFNTPYFSVSIKDFWRRWHVSLSSWFRDYLYIPMGGNRCSKPRKYLNLMVTFLVSGLWHGAEWSYVIWGGLHGIYQVIGDLTLPLRKKIVEICKVRTNCNSYKLTQMFVTFVLTTFAWIFFRADTISQALLYVKRMVTRWNFTVLFNGGLYDLGIDRFESNVLLVSLVILLLVDLVRYHKNQRIDVYLQEQNFWFRWLVCIGLLVMVFVYGVYGPSYDASEFIYFQF
ncbi:MAG: MBOAT family protein [Clostridiales bacterium]|nr:MBOAT family protein [Clostridiales bacterium]